MKIWENWTILDKNQNWTILKVWTEKLNKNENMDKIENMKKMDNETLEKYLTRNSALLNGNGPFWTTRIRMASMINQSVIWIKKKLIGSHWKRKDTAQAVRRPKIIHSVKGSIKMVDGIMAERNLAHLQWQNEN